MKRLFLALVLSTLASVSNADVVKVASPYPVAQTLDRLTDVVTQAGATVFARVEHTKGAEMIGQELPPMAVLIFGKPEVGTPAMMENPTAGVVLPARVLAYQDADGQVWLVYENPSDMFAQFGIAPDAPVVETMTKVLGALTGRAVAE